MSDLLNTGASWLSGQLQAHAASAVTYQRGGESVSILATLGGTKQPFVDAGGIAVEYESRDFVFPATSLVIGGVQVKPERGDLIVQVIGGRTLTCQVLPLPNAQGANQAGESCWRYTNQHCVDIRVHTKVVSEA